MLNSRPSINNAGRYFYRCSDCLSVFAIDWANAGLVVPVTVECGACSGKARNMGKVTGLHLSQRKFACPCDGRCTGAKGPKCDCQCGGVNHGGAVLVILTVNAGPIPRANVLATDKALAIVAEWRALKEEARVAFDAKFGRVIRARERREYLSQADWGLFLSAQWNSQQLSKAERLKTVKGRAARVRELITHWSK